MEQNILDLRNKDMMESKVRQENPEISKAYFQNEQNERVVYDNQKTPRNKSRAEAAQQNDLIMYLVNKQEREAKLANNPIFQRNEKANFGDHLYYDYGQNGYRKFRRII